MNDLDRAITMIRRVLPFTTSNDSDRIMYLNLLGFALKMRFERKGSLEDLNQAIAIQEQAIASAPNNHAGHAGMLDHLATTLRIRFQHTGSMDDLDRAVTLMEQVLSSTAADDQLNRATYLNNLAAAPRSRFERKGSLDDLNRAVAMNEQAVASTSDVYPDRMGLLNNLGSALHIRYERTGLLNDLDRAIIVHERAVALTPLDHHDRPTILNNLGTALQTRFERIGTMEDLNLAIMTNEQVIASTTDDNPDRALYLSNLGTALQRRSERTGSIEDLNQSIIVNAQAVELTPSNHPDRSIYFNNLGSALQRRFERTGLVDDLNQAIVNKEQAVKFTPGDHPDLAMYLNNLGTALQRRFERTGSIEDLDQAITINDRAVLIIPDGHSNRSMYLNNLGIALQRRFQWIGSMEDLDRAIITNEQAVISTSSDHPSRVMYLNNLANALQIRFERTQSMVDIDRAIMIIEQAVSIPVDHPDRAAILNNLGAVLQRRFEQTGSMEDLNQAILTGEQAVTSAPDDHPDRAGMLNNLGTALQRRFDGTKLMEDLDRAITTMEQAVASSSDDHPNYATFLNGLGNAFRRRFELTGSRKDLDRAITTNEQAAAVETAPPSIKIGAADLAARLLIQDGRDWGRANTLLRTAVELLPNISPRVLNQIDQQYQISQFAGITSRAVSVSLQCGEEPYRAVQLSELGNGILATLQLQVRSDIVVLEKLHPDLAKEFHHFRDQLDRPPVNLIHTKETGSGDDAESRRRLSTKFDMLLADIRNLEGFEQFLLAPSESDLKGLAKYGPIVVFNVSEIRSDALVVAVDEIRLVSLPLLVHSELYLYTNRFLSAVHAVGHKRYAFARTEIHEVLKWMWDVAVNPVLDHLECSQSGSSNSGWRRVWWVGSGLLNVLPIHAAGYHQSGSTRNAIDRVISSYTPTLKALGYARERKVRAASVTSQKAMLVGMSKTPHQRDLRFVEQEINTVNDMLLQHVQTTVIEKPTRDKVLSCLNDYQIVHFSCHGYSSAGNPSESKLLLTDWEMSPLTVSDFTSLNLQAPQLAYLSACHSASSRDLSLLGESINLSSAIQLAGYPTVIGTLWQVTDKHSTEIAKDVYNWILVENKLNTERSAESWHRAVRSLRERTRILPGFTKDVPDDPLIWAPYIHIGV